MKETQIDSANPIINRTDYISKAITYLKKYLKYIIAAAIVGAVIGNCIAHYLITPKYKSYLDLYVNVNNNPETKISDSINAGDIDASKKLINSYIVTLKSNIVTNQILEKLNGRITKWQLLGSMSFSSVESTEVLRIMA